MAGCDARAGGRNGGSHRGLADPLHRAAVACIGVLALTGCDRAATPPWRLAVVEHLVSLPATTLEGEPGTPESWARARERTSASVPDYERIGNEARPVLRGYPFMRSQRRMGLVQESEPETLVATFPLPPEFGEYPRALVTTGALANGTWLLRAATSLPIDHGGSEPRVEVRFPRESLASDAAGVRSRAWMRVQVRALPSGRFRRIQTAPVRLPAGARLELGLGILDAASEQGDVAFELFACEADDCTSLLAESLDPQQSRGWRDHSVPLDPLAGRDVAFRFESVHTGDGRFSLPVWSDPVLLAPRPDDARRPSLLLVSLDTLRADRLPSYAYPRDTAPFIEQRLARRGVVFERALSAASTTGPSHMTAFTAHNPSVHGLRDNIRTARLPEEIPTLAERLRDAGFATGAVTENGALAFGSGIERGFGSYAEFRPVGATPHRAEATFAAARQWIERRGERPFLLFVHTYETHTPYRAPDDTPALSGPPAVLAGEHADLRLREDWQPESYDREIRYVDAALRAFVEGLETAGVLDDTLLVLFSDHGEAFLEHDYLHHGGGIHDEVLHVPLIFVGPGAARGRRVNAPVGLVDLLPTLLDLLKLPPVEGVMGRSFADLVRGEAANADWWQRPLFSEAWSGHRVELVEGRIHKVRRHPPALAVHRGQRKLIREDGPEGHRYAYFDLESDPGERRDLYPTQPEAAADLRELLEDYERQHLVAAADELPSDDALDPEREEALRALGYLE